MAKRKTIQAVVPAADGTLVVKQFDAAKEACFRATTQAVEADGKAEHKWVEAAPTYAKAYGTYQAMLEARAEIVQNGILPGFDEAIRTAHDAKLPDARTKEGKAEGQAEKREERKKAQTKVSDIWVKLCGYAFPTEHEAAEKAKREAKKAKREAEGKGDGEGEEGDTGSASLKTKGDVAIAALIKAHEKAVNGNPGVIKYLRKALEENAKTRDDEPGEE